MIELWGRKNAYNVMKVTWALQELGLDYRHHDVGSDAGDLDRAQFLAINPHARIPVILDRGEHVWESNTILRYLYAEYGAPPAWPRDALARSRAERWMDWELATLQPDFIDLFWGYYRTPPARRDEAALARAGERCRAHFRQLDARLEKHPYLAGDDFTMADIPCATPLFRYFEMGWPVEKPRHVMAWYVRLGEREAYRQNIMLPFDELEGRTDF